jgi:acetyl-CoA acetyltransferase
VTSLPSPSPDAQDERRFAAVYRVRASAGTIEARAGAIALGHPFGATGARILSQAVKEVAAREAGARAIVSICADGGLGSVALLESVGAAATS